MDTEASTNGRLPAPAWEDSVRLMEHLAHAFDHDLPAASMRPQLESLTQAEPLETLAAIAPAAGLTCALQRMRVADAVWLADHRVPIVAWAPAERRWVVLTRHGFFRARMWMSSSADDESVSIGRHALARLLGAQSANDLVDAAVVQPAAPAAGAAAAAPHDDHDHAEMTPVRRLVALMRPEARDLWVITVFSAITGLLYLALPLAVNAFISNLSFGTRSGPFLQGLVAIAVVLFLCLAVAGALRGLQHVVAEVIQRRIFVRLGADIAHRLPRVDLEALDSVHAPELVNRFLDVVTVQKSASMLLLTGINLVLGAAIGLTVLAFYHPFLLAFSLTLLVAVGLIVVVGGRRAVATSVLESRCKYQVVDWLEEIARHPRVFKGPGGNEMAMARADEMIRGYLQARSGHFRILMRQISSLLALEVLAATALLGVGGWLVLSQQLTLGQLVASEIIVSALVASISKLGKQFEAWYDAVAAMDKLGHLVDLRLERTGGEVPHLAPEGGLRVEVRDLAYARVGRKPTFEGLTFSVAPGERVALLGSRGSGSSLVLEVLMGMRPPAAGEVSVEGMPVRAWDLQALRSQACILRSTDLIAGSVADNIRLGRTWMPVADVQRALEQVGLASVVRQLPEGLSTPLVTGGLPLAGRHRARLLAARALAHQPRLLLIDELLDGHEGTLDSLSRVLLDGPHPWTVIVATRDPRVAARCGRTVEVGSSPEVLNHV